MEWIRHVNWTDALAIIIILRSSYVGSQRGLFGELFCIFGLLLAIVLSLHYYYSWAQFMFSYLFMPRHIANILSFVLIAVLVYALFVSVYHFVLNRKILTIEELPDIYWVGGVIFGFMKGVVIASILFLALLLVPIKYITDSAKTKSMFGPFLASTGVAVYEKSLSLFANIRARDLSGHLSGAPPLDFDKMKIKRKDKLEQILE